MTFLPSKVSVAVLPSGTCWPSNHRDSRTHVPWSFDLSVSPSFGLGSFAAVRRLHVRRAVKVTHERQGDLLVIMVVPPREQGKSAASTTYALADETRP